MRCWPVWCQSCDTKVFGIWRLKHGVQMSIVLTHHSHLTCLLLCLNKYNGISHDKTFLLNYWPKKNSSTILLSKEALWTISPTLSLKGIPLTISNMSSNSVLWTISIVIRRREHLLVIGALQSNHVSDNTCDIIYILFTFYILAFYHFILLVAYMHIYCDVNGSVQ